ncbi:MAG: hypothetical protein C4326_05335 [Ignavibacteria bacterium]
MLERETELITQIIVESTLGDRGTVKLNEVLTADVPRGIKVFMMAEVMKMLEAELRQSPRLLHIAKGFGEADSGERAVVRTLAAEYAFERNEYLAMVENAVHFLENFLCRPQWTLRELFFEKSDRITLDELVRKFDYTVDYAYYRDVLIRYMRMNGIRELTAEQGKQLIATIDEAVVRQHSPRELALLTRPIYEFLLFGDATMTRPIPLGAILIFFDDKNMTAVREYIERICAVRSRTQLSLNELIGILEDLYEVESEVKKEIEQSEEELLQPDAEPQPLDALPSAEGVTQPDLGGASSEAPPTETGQPPSGEQAVETATAFSSQSEAGERRSIDEQPAVDVTAVPTSELEKESLPVEKERPTIAQADVLVEFAHERSTKQRHSFMLKFPERTHHNRTGSDPSRLLGDIHAAFTEAQRTRFIKKIFKGDENYFFIFLSSLKDVTTWRDAQPYLRDLFEMNNLHHLAPDVIEFTDAMHAYFHPELKNVE